MPFECHTQDDIVEGRQRDSSRGALLSAEVAVVDGADRRRLTQLANEINGGPVASLEALGTLSQAQKRICRGLHLQSQDIQALQDIVAAY